MMSQQALPRHLTVHSKCKFTADEDAKLKELVKLYGDSDWSRIVQFLPGRNIRQCRERWRHYLSPEVSNKPFTPEEDALLKDTVAEFGKRWKQIATFFTARTDIAIKNRWLLIQRHETRQTHSPVMPVHIQEPEFEWDEIERLYPTDLSTDYFCVGFRC